MASGSPRNPSLDTLRALAIAGVVVCHLIPEQAHGLWEYSVSELGARGVDLFFVLSGYLVGGIALRELKRDGRLHLGRFWASRWMRTLPAYYVTLALYALKQWVPHRSLGLRHPASYLVFLQGYLASPLTDFAHSWSLCVEEHFYLVLPLLVGLAASGGARRLRQALALVGGLGLFLLALRLNWVLVLGHEVNERFSHWRTDGLVAGVLLAGVEIAWPRAVEWLGRARIPLVAGTLFAACLASVLDIQGSWLAQTAFAAAATGAVALGVLREPFLDRLGCPIPEGC